MAQGVFMALYDTAGRAIAGDATTGPYNTFTHSRRWNTLARKRS